VKQKINLRFQKQEGLLIGVSLITEIAWKVYFHSQNRFCLCYQSFS